jgi:hypothetical protein
MDMGRDILVLENDAGMKFDLHILFLFIIFYGAEIA